jgi:hypothetical protein
MKETSSVSNDAQPDDPGPSPLAEGVGFVVYGTVATLAGVGALELEAGHLRPGETAVALLVVVLAAWMGHTLWRVVTARALRTPPQRLPHETRELRRSWPIPAAALPEVVVTALAATGWWSVTTGLQLAQGLGIAVLFGAGVLTARLEGASRGRLLAYACLLPSVGAVIVALEVGAHRV